MIEHVSVFLIYHFFTKLDTKTIGDCLEKKYINTENKRTKL